MSDPDFINVNAIRAFRELLPTISTTPAETLVLQCLCEHVDNELICNPGRERIMRFTNLSRYGVTKALAQLEDRGLILVDRYDPTAHGPRRSNWYKVVCIGQLYCPIDRATPGAGQGNTVAPNKQRIKGHIYESRNGQAEDPYAGVPESYAEVYRQRDERKRRNGR